MNLQTIVDEINKRHEQNKLLLVAIDGRSGSGKSALAERLREHLTDTTIVHLDSFDLYRGKTSIQKVISEVFEPLKNDKEQKGFVIIEGIFALSSDLEQYYDYKIWIDCPAEIGYKRGLQRDIRLNGTDNSDKWINYWLPKEEEYIQKDEPQKKSDFIVDGTTEFK